MLSAILCAMLMMPLVSPSSHHCHRGSVLLISSDEVGVNVSLLFVLYFSRSILIIVKWYCLQLTLLLIVLYNRSSSLYKHTYIFLICSHRQWRIDVETSPELTVFPKPQNSESYFNMNFLPKGLSVLHTKSIFYASYWSSRLAHICLKPRNEHNVASSWDPCYKLLT